MHEFKLKFNSACFFSYAPSLSNGVGISGFNKQILNGSFCVFYSAVLYLNLNFYHQNVNYLIVCAGGPLSVVGSFRKLEPRLLCTHSCIPAGDFNCVIVLHRRSQT